MIIYCVVKLCIFSDLEMMRLSRLAFNNCLITVAAFKEQSVFSF